MFYLCKMSIQEIQNEIVDEFSFFENWEERYEHLIELGKSLKPLPEEKKSADKVIKGCQSTVWLDAKMQEDKLVFEADSDAILPKRSGGIVGSNLQPPKSEGYFKFQYRFYRTNRFTGIFITDSCKWTSGYDQTV